MHSLSAHSLITLLSLQLWTLTNALLVPIRGTPLAQLGSLERRTIITPKINANVLAASGDGEGDHSDAVTSTKDVLYIANVTIEGTEYPLQMDTGSSDLWVNMDPQTPQNATTTNYNLTYGTGYAYGPIAVGPVSFAGYDIPTQAYLDFKQGANPVLNFGAVGIVGLGFTTLSHIDSAITAQNNQTWGKSLLYNIFALNPTEPNYIAMSLERSTDSANTVIGSLGVGETVETYSSISSTDHIPLYPPQGSTRWTILLDSFAVNGASQTVSSAIEGVPDGRVVVLLDSGTTYSYAPKAVANAIYGGVSGAVLNETLNQWQVPCSAGIRLTLWIGGKAFDIHPLDVVIPSLGDPTKCIGSFMPSAISVGASEFDWILGTNILRSVYALYDFGDFDSNNVMGNPYIQLLSLVDINAAATIFQSERGGTVNVDSGNGQASDPVTVLTTDQKMDQLMNLIPMIFAVLGANALILITLLGGLIWLCCYLRKQKRGKKKTPAPLQLGNMSRGGDYEAVATQDADEPRPSSVQTRLSNRISRVGSKQSLSSRSIKEGLPELGTHHPNASSSSLLRPSINIERDVDTGSSRSSRVNLSNGVGVPSGGESRRNSRLTPPGSGSGSPGLAPQRHSRVSSNLVPASPSPTAPFFQHPSAEEGLVDVSLEPHSEAGDLAATKMDGSHLNEDVSELKKQLHAQQEREGKKKYTFDPPPPISVMARGVRQSMASDMSASPTVAGSEAHFALSPPDKGMFEGSSGKGRERHMSAYGPAMARPNPSYEARPNSSYVPERARQTSLNSSGHAESPLRQSSLNSNESSLRQNSLNATAEPSPLRQSSLNNTSGGEERTPASARSGLTPSPTESQYVDARQSYYSHGNGSLSILPVETPGTGRTSMLNPNTPASANLAAPANTPMSAGMSPISPAVHAPANTPITPAIPVVVEEHSGGLGYLQDNDATPVQSPRQPAQGRTLPQTHARTSSKSHARTSSQHSRTGSHARSPSQQAAQAQAMRQQAQESQRAAFMAALDEPLPAPRRPRVPGAGGLAPGGEQQMRMSAYHLNPNQGQDPYGAQLNRYSYAPGQDSAGLAGAGRPFPSQGDGAGPQRSLYAPGPPRRAPYNSNPSPFNPSASGNVPNRPPPAPPS